MAHRFDLFNVGDDAVLGVHQRVKHHLDGGGVVVELDVHHVLFGAAFAVTVG